jgi:hypothetical protein
MWSPPSSAQRSDSATAVAWRSDSGKISCSCGISRCHHRSISALASCWPGFIGRSGTGPRSQAEVSELRRAHQSSPAGIWRRRLTPIPARHLYACEESERPAPSVAPSGALRPWKRRARRVAAGSELADHSTARAPPPQGTAGYAPLPLRGAQACRDSVPMPGQAHLLRSPIWQGRWPADCSPYVSLVSWRPCMQYGMRKSPPPLGTGRHVVPRQSDVAGGVEGPKVSLIHNREIVILPDPYLFFEISSLQKSSTTSCKAVTATPLNN